MATQGDISYSLAIGAGQSVRRNAGDTAFEAYTPSSSASLQRCSVYASADVNIVSAATWETVPFNSERIDSASMHDNVTNNSRITVQSAGDFQLNANLQFGTTGTSIYLGARIRKNGSTVVAERYFSIGPNSQYYTTIPLNCCNTASATTDYYEVQIIAQGSIPTVSLLGGIGANCFEAIKIG